MTDDGPETHTETATLTFTLQQSGALIALDARASKNWPKALIPACEEALTVLETAITAIGTTPIYRYNHTDPKGQA